MHTHRLRRNRALGLAAVAVASAALALLAYGTDLLRSFELNTVDTRFSIRGAQPKPSDLAVVQIDDQTFNRLGLQWPFPRHLHAELIDRLRQAGAKAIAYDVQFTEPTTPREDAALIRAVARDRGHVVLSTTEVNGRGQTNIFGGGGILSRIGARAGSTTIQPDPGGVLRRVPLSDSGLTGFAVAATDVARGTPAPASPPTGSAWIDYRGPPGTIPTVLLRPVLAGKVSPSAFQGKIVVVGASAPSLQDTHTTPTTADNVMSGPEVQANAIWTVEHGLPLRASAALLDAPLILLMAIAPPLLNLRLKPFAALGAAAGLGALYAVGRPARLRRRAHPAARLSARRPGDLGGRLAGRDHDHYRLRAPVGPRHLLALRARGRGRPTCWSAPTRRTASAGSGARAPSCSATCAASPRSRVARARPGDRAPEPLPLEMSDAIMDHGGTLVAYMGDGIMAVFGAPIEQPDHADRALAATREMLGERLPRFNQWIHSEGLGDGFQMGVGLNSGPVMSGQVGSERRMEYTAVGDTTNTAARLEGMTKDTPHSAFVADSTKQALRDGANGLAFVDEFPVRGREATIRVWTLATAPNDAPGPPAGSGTRRHFLSRAAALPIPIHGKIAPPTRVLCATVPIRPRTEEDQMDEEREQHEQEKQDREDQDEESSEVEGHSVKGHIRSEDESDDEGEGGDQGDKGRFASDARLKREIRPLGDPIARLARLGG